MVDRDLLEKTNKAIQMSLGDSFELLHSLQDESVDLIITSPPYCMGREYECLLDDENSFIDSHERILPEAVRVLKKGGSLCWQIGYHVKNSEVIPLDILIYNIIHNINNNLDSEIQLKLRNRIVWTFGHGLHSSKRLSGRHETILWFTKGDEYTFNLDEIRVPQKYPGKTYHKGDKKGLISGNPNGKNPSDVWTERFEDVWDIPNVKSKHPEKTDHPCQFPSAIPIRLIKALTNVGDVVLDPFMGSGTTALAAILNDRIFIGGELDKNYFEIAKQRVIDAINGKAKIRPDEPIHQPKGTEKVTKKPDFFK
ncbi:MAG: site-specific DNA-methyltransferase [Bacillota bacterium]